MKRNLATLIAGLVLSSAAAASAAPSGDTVRTYAGITCTWLSSTSEGGAVCRQADGTGLAVFVTQRFAGVRTWRTGKVLFFRNQPTHSPGFGPLLKDKRIFHSETHRGIACSWSRVSRGVAACTREDRHGYAVAVSRFQALVINENSQIVFLKNQP